MELGQLWTNVWQKHHHSSKQNHLMKSKLSSVFPSCILCLKDSPSLPATRCLKCRAPSKEPLCARPSTVSRETQLSNLLVGCGRRRNSGRQAAFQQKRIGGCVTSSPPPWCLSSIPRRPRPKGGMPSARTTPPPPPPAAGYMPRTWAGESGQAV
jgi:hypothetical protein